MACADVQTIQAGNGSKTQFSFDFPYLFKSEITVSFWNATTKEWDAIATTDATYPWQVTDANPTIVEFTSTAPPSPATPVDPGETAVDNVRIRRVTNIDDIRALFNPGSAIRSDDLNKNFEQLRYAIQEANCQGVPDDIYQYLLDNYWDRFDNTLYDNDTWVSNDTKIATTAALDDRIDSKIDAAINNDIESDGTGITVTDGPGTITLGLADNSIDFDKLKDSDQIQLADQVANYEVSGSDDKIFTASAAIRRFENYVQNNTPSTAGIGKGAVWVDEDDDLTLSVWNGSAWLGITSGGTFTNQPKVVYVDASSGSDENDGHRISRPKATIKAAINQINADATYGDGSVVVVAAGVYQEVAPIQIQKRDVSIVGTSLRSCVIHPTPATETNNLFEVNSGTYLKNLTFTGVKASGTRGAAGSLWQDATYGLPPTQGWNVAFLAGATIVKSPYIQNCTNFSDSEIDNSNLNFYSGSQNQGRAGDTDSAVTGGGLLVDGSVVSSSSPLRSMVCDSYTHVGLDGPGIFVTNNGYVQATSSYAFFNHFHIACLNGGQANLAASTTDFGRFSLIADGKSTTAIFTSNVDGAASSGDLTFNINQPAAAASWHGSTTRPQDNMLVQVNGVIYPVLSASAHTDSEGGSGWTVTISRPDPTDTATNLGLNGAVSDNAAVSFYLRSMIASSGHTMEYVGSGTNYSALPENGGVPNDNNQAVERNNGKVWSAITDHKGKFSLGDFFTVDQQAKSISVNPGSFQVDLSTLTVDGSGNAVFGAPLDMGANQITSSTGDLKLNASGDINAQTNKIINVVDPTAAQDAATKAYVDNQIAGIDEVVEDLTPQLGGDLDANGHDIILGTGTQADPSLTFTGDTNTGIYSPGADQVAISTNSVERVKLGTSEVVFNDGGNDVDFRIEGDTNANLLFVDAGNDRVGLGIVTPRFVADVTGTSNGPAQIVAGFSSTSATVGDGTAIGFTTEGGQGITGRHKVGIGSTRTGSFDRSALCFYANDTASAGNFTSSDERMRITSDGKVGLGTSSPGGALDVAVGGLVDGDGAANMLRLTKSAFTAGSQIATMMRLRSGTGTQGTLALGLYTDAGGVTGSFINQENGSGGIQFRNGGSNTVRIDSSGRVGIGTTSPGVPLQVNGTIASVTANGTAARIDFDQNAAGSYSIQVPASTNALAFRDLVANSERARIDSSGRVGIGTTSPGTYNANLAVYSAGGGFSSVLHSNTSGSFPKASAIALGSDAVTYTYSTNGGTVAVTGSAHIAAIQSASSGAGTDIAFINTSGGSVTEKARIDSSGRLLVGTSTARTLQIDGGNFVPRAQFESTDAIQLALVRTNAGPYLTLARGSTGTNTANNDALGFISFNGYDGTDYQNGASIGAFADGEWKTSGDTTDAPSRLVFSTTADGASSPTERMRITNAGLVSINAGNGISGERGLAVQASETLGGTGIVHFRNTSTDASADSAPPLVISKSRTTTSSSARFIQFYADNSTTPMGGIVGNGASNVQFATISDVKEKENIQPLTEALSKIKQLEVVSYDWKTSGEHVKAGFIAQNVETVFPEYVVENMTADDAEPRKGITGGLSAGYVAVLTAALQEAIAKIETLEAKVAALEGA